MTITTETTLDDFNPWAGACDHYDELAKHPAAFAAISELLDEWSEQQRMTETDVNDFLWFELYEELENLGLYDCDRDEWTAA